MSVPARAGAEGKGLLPATVLLLGWAACSTDVGSEVIAPLLPAS